MLTLADTIVAVATPPGEGGVAIVRLSGPRALEIGQSLVHPSSRQTAWTSHYLVHGHVVDAESGRRVDEVLATYMAAPRTYTAEDVFEIHCHGGPMPVRAVVELALRHGARAADRGEFTLRAFLNGRLDLSQAEAVLDVVRARTPTALQVAVGQLAGTLTRRLYPLVDDLMGVLAYLEASIDFVEEGIPSTATEALLARLAGARDGLRDLLATAHDGIILREGVRAVLAGAPNVGKSSLLNRLLRVERAIVTPIAGTTRDTVEEPANIRDLPVYLVDTAGLTESDDPVERIGVQRSRAAIAAAGLLLLVADASRPFEPRDREAFAAARAIAPETPAVLVLNKCDLPPRLEPSAAWPFPDLAQPSATVAVSAATGDGLEGLEEAIAAAVLTNGSRAPDAAMVTNARHRRALEEAVEALEATIGGIEGDQALELICSDLRAATHALGSITGQDIGEDLLSRIFSEFCIGK
ncbi:MAG TPA: tRNA uridine-5-carboxymethylaminomethyl(34) synthesis GTPase MnmE [Chloroflexota bacterium]|nr:tRNA uridine-5-carboxymethylaminomethyl(34) synthesis GTPase MnmE [Chloroflexota bacterium]